MNGFASDRVIRGERTKFSLFRVQAPATENDAQARHYGDREIDAENARDFASGHNPEKCGKRMQFRTVAHDARRETVVLDQAPGDQKEQQWEPVRIAHEEDNGDDGEASEERAD